MLLYFQIDKLVKACANVLAPIAIGPKRNMGTVVDYAYYMFYQVNVIFQCQHENRSLELHIYGI